MKIAINATIVEPTSSGLGIYTVNVVKKLARLYPDIVVYTSAPEIFGENGIELHRIPNAVRPSKGFKGHITRVLWSQRKLPRELRISGASVLLSPTPLEGLLRAPVPQVLIVHDLLPLRYPESYRRQTYYFRYVLPFMLNRAACIIAVSKTTKDEIVNNFGLDAERIRIIQNGCDHLTFRPHGHNKVSLPQGVRVPYLLYVGNLFPHKNLIRLLEAFALIAERLDHQLVIVGQKDPRYYPGLEHRARSLGIYERVLFLDYVQSEMLPKLYGLADWFILPSLYEGFGMTPVESMACGTPVLVSKTPALEETVGEAGIYFNAEDSSDLSQKIFDSCTGIISRQQMSSKGLQRAARFTWEKTASELLEVLKKANGSFE